MEIWEYVPMVERAAIADNYYEKFSEDKIGKWTLMLEDFKSGIYKNAENVPPDEVSELISKATNNCIKNDFNR